jgi:hypothetical protein
MPGTYSDDQMNTYEQAVSLARRRTTNEHNIKDAISKLNEYKDTFDSSTRPQRARKRLQSTRAALPSKIGPIAHRALTVALQSFDRNSGRNEDDKCAERAELVRLRQHREAEIQIERLAAIQRRVRDKQDEIAGRHKLLESCDMYW